MAHYKRNTLIGSAVAIVVGLSIGIGILYIPHQTAATQTPSLSGIVQNGCAVTYPTGLPLNSQISFNGSSTIFLCVKYYYYNSTYTLNLNLSGGQQLQFVGMVLNSNGPSWNAAPNFTVVSSMNSIAIGGANNQNEGAMVVYGISPAGIKSGSYILNIGFLANSQEDCASEYKLIVGNGTPNYYVGGSCTSPLQYHYPTNSEGFVDGFLYAEIVGTA